MVKATSRSKSDMANIISKAEITLTWVIDVAANMRYYKLQSSTASAPSKPTVNPPPSEWSTAEPSYTSGSTNTLYFVDCTIYSDGTFVYSDVSLSSSYEAAKAAYNKAVAADNKAQDAKDTVDNLEIGGRNMLRGSSFKGLSQVDNTYMKYKNNSVKLTVDNTSETSANKRKYTQINSLQQTWELSDVLGKTMVVSMWIYIEKADQLDGYELRIVYSADGTKYWNHIDTTYPYYMPSASQLKVGWNYVYCCYTIPTNATEAYFSFTCYATPGKTSTAWFSSPKAEMGNKPTQWTPAPEDMATADDVTQLTTRVTNAETSITQNKEAIELRATKTEVTETVDAVITRITEAESSIKQNSEAIELKVNQSTMNEALENLQIGTRNYIRNSQTMMWNDYVIVSAGDDKTGYVGSAIVGTSELDDGTVITAERLNTIETSNENTDTSITTIKEAMGI